MELEKKGKSKRGNDYDYNHHQKRRRTVHFDINKIASAIEKAFAATIGKKDYRQSALHLHRRFPIFLKKNKLTPLR